MDTATKGLWLAAGGLVAVVVGWLLNRIGLERYDNYYSSNPTPGLVIFWIGLLVSLAGLAAVLVGLFRIARSANSSVLANRCVDTVQHCHTSGIGPDCDGSWPRCRKHIGSSRHI